MNTLELSEVSFSYFNGLILKDINLNIKTGEMVSLLGPNGSGKTTLIKLISGIIKPKKGRIKLHGTDISGLSRKTIARSLAVVPQQFNTPFAFTVVEVVALGRMPFLKAFVEESIKDKQAIDNAMTLVGINSLRTRRFDELSGGERQKVVLAMALAQQPTVLLLDEPTVHLDISHQIDILELVRQLNLQKQITVLAAMHDLNLAAAFFDRIILIKEGEVFADGTPLQVLTEDKIGSVFSAPVKIEPNAEDGFPYIKVIPKRITH